MPRAFYAAWAAAVLLAVVLPIAIPYAIWPPGERGHGNMVSECGSRAKDDAIQARRPVASLWPLSSSVHACSRDEAGTLTYVATVDAKGPYGISFASAYVTPSDVTWTGVSGSTMFAMIALITGVVVVSIPFGIPFLRVYVPRVCFGVMPEVFWAGWAVAVLLAVIVPIAIPYAVWSTGATSTCELHALVPVESGTPFALVSVPLEITNERCIGDTNDPVAARIIAHGPYGIPFASAEITDGSYDSLYPDEGVFWGMLALMIGFFAVSLPFLAAFLHTHLRRMRTAPA